jgi:hypothetical protein
MADPYDLAPLYFKHVSTALSQLSPPTPRQEISTQISNFNGLTYPPAPNISSHDLLLPNKDYIHPVPIIEAKSPLKHKNATRHT